MAMAAVAVIAVNMANAANVNETIVATLFYEGPDIPYNLKIGTIDTSGTAWAQLDNTRMSVGWDRLQIGTSASHLDIYQVYAAGYLEGYLTAESIWNVYQNFQFRMLKNKPPAPELVAWLKQQLAWTRSMVQQFSRTDSYWAQVSLLMAQFDGMLVGYRDAGLKDKPLGSMEFYLFQSSGDLYDIIPAVVPHERINWTKLQPEEFNRLHLERSSCSALHRLTPDGQEIWAGHTTWTDYGSMVRTYKFYDFALNVTGARRVSFSAKPALLYSKDDFHVLSSGLTVIETTNGIRDEALYPNVRPDTLLTWQRIPVCNRIATNGKEWVDCFDKYFSGTYANQYQVLDYKLFTPGKVLQPGTLWINEQVPGYSRSQDVTAIILRNGGYWPSYNIPYDGFIYNISGFWTAYQKLGDGYSYLKCPRAQIFARDYKKVVDRATMQFMMQYNDYKSDPLSLGDPNNAICARSDLVAGGSAFGAIDGKITSRADAYASGLLRAYAISGPTQQQPVFAWSDRYSNITHLGEPTTFNFAWQTYQLINLPNTNL